MSCTPRGRQCDTAYIRAGLPTPNCCRDHLTRLVAAATRLFDEHGIRYWLDYGALLGAVREGGLIEHDNDADIGIHIDDWGKLKQLRAAAHERGFYLSLVVHAEYARAQVSFSNRLHICIFVWHPAPNGMLTRKNYMRIDDQVGKGKDFPAEWVENRSRVSWEGIEVWAPADPIRMIEHRYGSGWRRPVKHRQVGG